MFQAEARLLDHTGVLVSLTDNLIQSSHLRGRSRLQDIRSHLGQAKASRWPSWRWPTIFAWSVMENSERQGTKETSSQDCFLLMTTWHLIHFFILRAHSARASALLVGLD